MPGVRLNFSGSGVSASVGPRGATVTVGGVRGPAINLGIPGTGLYMRQNLTGSSRARGSRGPTKAQQAKWARDAARAEAQTQAAADFQEHEHELEDLATILDRREREPLDWVLVFGPSPAPAPAPYSPLNRAPRLADVQTELEASKPGWRWWVPAAAAMVSAWLAPQPLLRVSLVAVAAALVAHRIMVGRQIPVVAGEQFAARYAAFKQADHEAQVAHEAEEERRQKEHAESEAGKQAFRELEANENLALAAALLEVELSNEDLGVHITFEIGFEDLHTARLLVTLPELTATPTERVRLTKTGKLSSRPMAQRDRRELYALVCTGVALRLVYETYRVLPFVHRVQVIGTALRPGFSDSHHRYVGLALDTTRDAFHRVSLDRGTPTEVLQSMGGQFELSRDGTPKQVEGVHDDLE